MTETVEIHISEHHSAMLAELREISESNPDSDLRELVENAIHNGYQQVGG